MLFVVGMFVFVCFLLLFKTNVLCPDAVIASWGHCKFLNGKCNTNFKDNLVFCLKVIWTHDFEWFSQMKSFVCVSTCVLFPDRVREKQLSACFFIMLTYISFRGTGYG